MAQRMLAPIPMLTISHARLIPVVGGLVLGLAGVITAIGFNGAAMVQPADAGMAPIAFVDGSGIRHSLRPAGNLAIADGRGSVPRHEAASIATLMAPGDTGFAPRAADPPTDVPSPAAAAITPALAPAPAPAIAPVTIIPASAPIAVTSAAQPHVRSGDQPKAERGNPEARRSDIADKHGHGRSHGGDRGGD